MRTELYQGDELKKLKDGLEVIERVSTQQLNIFLFGIVTNAHILDISKDAILSNEEEFTNIELSEIAMVIPLSDADSIDILHGRGLKLMDLEFAYQLGEVEGARSLRFIHANIITESDKVEIHDLSKLELGDTENDLDDYLIKRGSGIPLKHKVQRDAEAVEPPGVSKQTSLKESSLRDIVEDFLG